MEFLSENADHEAKAPDHDICQSSWVHHLLLSDFTLLGAYPALSADL